MVRTSVCKMPGKAPIWTRTFILLCLVQLLGYMQQHMIVPILGLYIESLGGTPFAVSMVVMMFGVTGIFARPLAGALSDRLGEMKVMIAGTLIKGACAILFMVPSIFFAAFINGIRGIGWGALNVSGYSLFSAIAPNERKSEANGYYRGIPLGAGAILPVFALWILNVSGSFKAVFVTMATLSLIGAAIGVYLKNLLPSVETKAETTSEKKSFIDPLVRLPLVLTIMLQQSQNAVTIFAVLYAKEIGISNIGWLFFTSGLATAIAQPLLGRIADKIGFWPPISSAFILHTIGFEAFVYASSIIWLIAGGILYMTGLALGSTTAGALVSIRANKDPKRRGRVSGDYALSSPLSNIMGAIVIGSAITWFGYKGMYSILALIGATGFIITLANRNKLK